MPEGVPNLGDLFGALGGANPLTAIGKSIEQFRRTVDDLLHAVETFTTTMDTLNTVAGRVNRLLDDVEEPIRTIVPQVTATVKAAESMVGQLSGPMERVVPLLSSVSDALSNPNIGRLPDQLGEFLDALGQITERLGPFGQLLDGAGGLFRNNPLRSMLSAFDTSPPSPPPAPPAPPSRASKVTARPASAPAKPSKAAKAPSKAAPKSAKAASKSGPARRATPAKAATKRSAR